MGFANYTTKLINTRQNFKKTKNLNTRQIVKYTMGFAIYMTQNARKEFWSLIMDNEQLLI